MFKNEKSDRVKYIRALEKFAKSAINILKRDDFNEELFKQRVQKNLQALEKVNPIYLDNEYTKSLENFVNSVISLRDREELVKEANLLLKLKNYKSYKKEKHKKRKFNEYDY